MTISTIKEMCWMTLQTKARNARLGQHQKHVMELELSDFFSVLTQRCPVYQIFVTLL